jgi:AmiR/NasT family two-component response regulator
MDCLIYTYSAHWGKLLSGLLKEGGYGTARLAESREQLERQLEHQVPELLFILHEPPLIDALETKALLNRIYSISSVFVATSLDHSLADQAVAAGYASFLVLPAAAGAIHGVIASATETAKKLDPLETRIKELEQKLLERKVIERAKGLLMERERISEEQAFKKMRSMAMTRRIAMSVLAEEIVKLAANSR